MLKKLIRNKEFFSKITIEPVPKNTSLLFKIIKKDFERLKKDLEICKKDQEIQKLNNIINELEKYFAKPNKFIERPERMKILDKLKELKEDK